MRIGLRHLLPASLAAAATAAHGDGRRRRAEQQHVGEAAQGGHRRGDPRPQRRAPGDRRRERRQPRGRRPRPRRVRCVRARAARAAGLDARYQEFSYEYGLGDLTVPVLDVIGGKRYEAGLFGAFFGGEFGSDFNSPSGDVTAPLWAADLRIPSTGGSTSGCEAADYAGMPSGAVVLIQRGTCTFLSEVPGGAGRRRRRDPALRRGQHARAAAARCISTWRVPPRCRPSPARSAPSSTSPAA